MLNTFLALKYIVALAAFPQMTDMEAMIFWH